MHSKKAEANESISGVLMIPESCVCMFAHKRLHFCVSINLSASLPKKAATTGLQGS